MSELKIDVTIPPDQVKTAKLIAPSYSQSCLLCDNTHEIPYLRYYEYPWICDECKETIKFLKFLKLYNRELTDLIMKEAERSRL